MKKAVLFIAAVLIGVIIAASDTISFKVGGDIDKYYPVVFKDVNWSMAATELEIGRGDVHMDSSWRGSLIARFRFHTHAWGNGSEFTDAEIRNSVTPFIAGWKDVTASNSTFSFVLWLKGGSTTYQCRNNNSNEIPTPLVYVDGYQEVNGPLLTSKTAIDSYVNSSGQTFGNDVSLMGSLKTGRILALGSNDDYKKGEIVLGTTKDNPTWHIDDSDGKDKLRIFRQPNLETAGKEILIADGNGNLDVKGIEMMLGTNDYPAYYLRDKAWWMGLLRASETNWNDMDSFVFSAPTGRPFVFQRDANGRTQGKVDMIINDGNVGIGISEPSAKLQVNQGMLWVTGQDANNGNLPGLGFYGGANAGGIYFRGEGDTMKALDIGIHIGDIRFRTGGGGSLERLTIKNNGYIGIGTNDPQAGLHIYGDKYTLYGPNSTWGEYLQVGGNGRVTNGASVAATNGNLHLDAKDGSFSTYINWYSKNNTIINGLGGNVSIGTANVNSLLTLQKNNWISAEGNDGFLGISGGNPGDSGAAIVINSANRGPGVSNNLELYMGNNSNAEISFRKAVTGQLVSKIDFNGNFTTSGNIKAKELIITAAPWADFVFESDYKLKTLPEVEAYITANKRLPDMPSEADVKENGANVGDVQAKLLQKIEELTLYIIELNKKVERLENKN